MKREFTKDEIRKMVRDHLVRDHPEAARMSEEEFEEFEELVEHIHARQEDLIREYLQPLIRRQLIEMMNRGEVEYDPETDSYRSVRDQ